MTPATLTMTLVVLCHAVKDLICGKDASRWLDQIEALLRELGSQDERR